MGLFSQVFGDSSFSNWVDDRFKKSSGGGKSTREKAEAQVNAEYQEKRLQYHINAGTSNPILASMQDMVSYQQTDAYRQLVTKIEGQLNANQNPNGDTITGVLTDGLKGIANSALGGVKQGVNNALSGVTQNAINMGAEKAGIKHGKSLAETLGMLGSASFSVALKDWFKRNWAYVVFPVAGIIAYFAFRPKTAKRARTKRRR